MINDLHQHLPTIPIPPSSGLRCKIMGNNKMTDEEHHQHADDQREPSSLDESEQLTTSNLHYVQPPCGLSLIGEKQWGAPGVNHRTESDGLRDDRVYDKNGTTIIITKSLHAKGTRMQLLMSILANLTVLSSGMGLGYSAITLHALTSKDNPMQMDSSQASWFASISSIACPLGGLISGYLLDRIGRKKTLMLINVLSIVSWTMIAVCSRTNFDQMYTQVLTARVIIGIVIGLVSAPASIYSAEIATPKLRGRLTVLTSLMIAVGILVIYSMGYCVPDDFRLVAAMAAGICVVSLLLLFIMPESPAWLMSKHREEEAERSLKTIRGFGAYQTQYIPEVQQELMRLRDNVQAQRRAGKESFARLLRQPQVYKPLGIIVGFFGFQQFSGIFVIVVYAAKVSAEASVTLDPFLCTVLIGVTRVIATLLVAYILDTLGRKPPSIFSGIGMLVCMFGLAACIYFPLIEGLRWIPTVLILTYIFTSTLGFLTMPFSMLAELFPQNVRGPASGVTVFFTYLMSFFTIKLYPTMVELVGSSNVFIFFGLMSLLGVLYVHYFVPETKGKSLQEIEDYFRGVSHCSTPSQQVEEEDVSSLSAQSVDEGTNSGWVDKMSGKDADEMEVALKEQSPSKTANNKMVLTELTRKAAIKQIVMAVVANITIISSGMGIGFPSIAMIELTNSTSSVVLSESNATWFASITSIMCPFGGLLSGYLLDRIGRKKTLYFINFISVVSWAIMSFASRTDSTVLFIQLIVARIIIGIAIGLSSTPASVYAAEVAHPNLRGRLTLLTAFCTAIGMLCIYTLGYVFKNDWRFVCMICGIFTVVSLLTVIPLPESPSWLVSKKRMEKAERCLKVVRAIKEDNNPEIRAELDALEDNIARFRASQTKKSKIEQLKKPEVYKPLAIMCTFFFFQQFTGIFVIIVYAASFSIEAGVAIDPFLSAVFVGLTRVVTTVLMSFISDKFGRRPPALFSGFGMACCMFGLAYFAVHPVKGTSLSWIPTVLLVAFIFTATLGFLTLPFSMNAEVYPTKIRGFASGLTIFFGYTMSFIIIKVYPSLVESIGNANVFIMFGSLSLLGIAFVYFFLPETKGRTLEDIENRFRGVKQSRAEVEMKTILKPS
ncbi:uncharacterized protein LOC125950919 [Anopheles darlingi]|uniref:uncharacterized protein LOC125950919 n=1 Tax=Anopheles darlingi TaxID=43151 RepID=UPI0021001409|nr:uncharacterized protein LOC125950919 [Anopheles darlingi]